MKSVIDLNVLPQPQKVFLKGKKKRIILISGPTASGKTALSLDLAGVLGGEIVSADSCQVYRGMDIGTAKPSAEERALFPHHLIDICDLDESFNVSQFYHSCQLAFEEIFQRENVPIIVGGTGFYIHSLLYGPPVGPPSDPEIRDRLEFQMREMGPEVLYERLQILDPIYAATISEFDRHKIIRALEIMAISDQKVSDFPKQNELIDQEYDFRCWFIYYSRESLYARIEKRCDEMLELGFLNEVEGLDERGIRLNLAASRAIGYRQALEFLDSPRAEEDKQKFIQDFKKATRHYAKRQFTWFRKEPLFRWVNVEEIPMSQIKELILRDFEQGI